MTPGESSLASRTPPTVTTLD